METIGRSGFWTTCERYYGGDVVAYMTALSHRNGHGTHFDPHLGCQVSGQVNR